MRFENLVDAQVFGLPSHEIASRKLQKRDQIESVVHCPFLPHKPPPPP